jgi:hypothetical protein
MRAGQTPTVVTAADVLAGDSCEDAGWVALMDAAPNSEGHISVVIQITSDSSTQVRTWWDPDVTLTVYR